MNKDELKQWRTERGLTRKALAQLISAALKEEFSLRNIENWEQGRRAIPAWLAIVLEGITLPTSDLSSISPSA